MSTRRFGISARRHYYLDGYNSWQFLEGGGAPFDAGGISLPPGQLPVIRLARPVRDPTPPRGLAFDRGGRAFASRDGEPGLCDLPGCEPVDPCLLGATCTRVAGLALDRRGRLYLAAPDADELRIVRLSPPGELLREAVPGILSVAAAGDWVFVLARGTEGGTLEAGTSGGRVTVFASKEADAIAASSSGALAAVSSRGTFIDFRAAGAGAFHRIELGRRTLPAIAFGDPDASGAETLYVGDQASGRVVRYRISTGAAPLAEASSWSVEIGSWAALAHKGAALHGLGDGCGEVALTFESNGFFAADLDVYVGPLDGGENRTEWHRMTAGLGLPDGASLEVSVLASDDCDAFALDPHDSSSDSRWTAPRALVSPAAGGRASSRSPARSGAISSCVSRSRATGA